MPADSPPPANEPDPLPARVARELREWTERIEPAGNALPRIRSRIARIRRPALAIAQQLESVSDMDQDQQRDYAEEKYNQEFCPACGTSPCEWDGIPDGFHTD